jgi:hypothetical protein
MQYLVKKIIKKKDSPHNRLPFEHTMKSNQQLIFIFFAWLGNVLVCNKFRAIVELDFTC